MSARCTTKHGSSPSQRALLLLLVHGDRRLCVPRGLGRAVVGKARLVLVHRQLEAEHALEREGQLSVDGRRAEPQRRGGSEVVLELALHVAAVEPTLGRLSLRLRDARQRQQDAHRKERRHDRAETDRVLHVQWYACNEDPPPNEHLAAVVWMA
eukprot:556894-Pleurochrysis_carterae.AAC.1